MDKDLRSILEEQYGLPPAANEQAAQEFFARLSLDTKGKIGVEMGMRGYGDTVQSEDVLTIRSAPDPANARQTPPPRVTDPAREAEPQSIQPRTGRDEPLTVRSTVDAPPLDFTTRAFRVGAESVDEETRSVEAVIATDQPVTVYDYRSGELIDEVLRMDGAQFDGQVPMLANHSRWSLDDVYGSAREITVNAHEMRARLFFAEGADDVERAWLKVRGGHIRDVSIGYRAEKYTDIRPGQSVVVGGVTYRARGRTLRITTRWIPREVSLVPIGADSRSKIRADSSIEDKQMDELRKYLVSLGLRVDADDAEAKTFLDGLEADQAKRAAEIQAEIDKRNDHSADDSATHNERADAIKGTLAISSTDMEQAVSNALDKREKEQQEFITRLEELAGDDVSNELVGQAIREGWTIEKAGRKFLDYVRDRGPSGPAIHSRSHDKNCNARSLAAGLLSGQGMDPTKHTMHNGRADPGHSDSLTEQDAERGDEFRGMSGYDLVRECILMDTGKHVRTRQQAVDAVRAAPGGGTLAYVFTTNVYASIIAGWDEVADSTSWCDSEDVPDFLEQEDISLTAETRLKRLPRGGTAKDATISDSHEVYKIARYARTWVLDEQDIINDRLGALMKMPKEMGEAAARLRPDLVYSLLLANANLADAGALFNNTAVSTAGGHKNLTTAALAESAMTAAILAMGAYREGDKVLNIRPRYLIVPSALQWTAKKMLSSAEIAQVGDTDATYYPINVIRGENLTLVIDDRIGAAGVMDPTTERTRSGLDTNWFLSSGGSRTIRVAYRTGTNRRPSVRSFTLDRGQWGMGWDINMDIGAKAMDYRGLHKSTGAG